MPTITLTTTAEQATRIANALGAYWRLTDGSGNARAATAEEVKTFLTRHLKGLVIQQERRQSEAAVTVPDMGDIS